MNLKFISICIAIIIGLAGLLALAQARLQEAREERDQAIKYSISKDDSLVHMKTKLGQASARSEVLDLTVQNLKRLQSDKELAWIKEIEGIKKGLKNVEQIISTTATVASTFDVGLKDTTIYKPPAQGKLGVDSIFAKAFDNGNQWIRLKGYILPDTLVITPRVNVPLQSVVYWQRKKWIFGLRLGKKEWFKQTTSLNPYVTITEDKLIRVSKHAPK